MCLPLVAIGVAIGSYIGYRVRGRFIEQMEHPGGCGAHRFLSPFFIAAQTV